MSEKCPVCCSDVPEPTTFSLSARDVQGYRYSCPRCGDYRIEDLAFRRLKAILDDDQKRAVLSHWIRSRHEAVAAGELRGEEPVTLTDDLIDDILKQAPPKPAEQADKFVLWLGDSKHPPGEPVLVEPTTHQSIMGAATGKGFLLVIDDLVGEGILKNVTAPVSSKRNITLSCRGWQQYDRLKRGAIDSRKAFMAMPYGEKELDRIVEDVFKPAVQQTGFVLSRLDGPGQPAGLIDDSLRVAIRTSRFLIADLTHENRGAYWEAGYAEGLGKHVIYTCEEKKFEELQTHFDTNHHLTIKWDAEDPDKLGHAAEKLKSTIRATLPAEAKLTDD